jgi:hypothetical protein
VNEKAARYLGSGIAVAGLAVAGALMEIHGHSATLPWICIILFLL